MTLKEIRKATGHTQEEMARRLSVQQSAVSKLEKRQNTHLDSIKSFIEALGGELKINAIFPGKDPMEIDLYD